MKFDTVELERLASTLETGATVAEALAQKHAKAREIDDAEKQTTRAKNGRHYAAICREAARRLKIREKRKGFVPPSWEETLDYATAKHPSWPHRDVQQWWNHFESCGWKIGTGKQMVCWQKAADNGFARWQEKHPSQAVMPFAAAKPRQVGKDDPAGWREYLLAIKRPYRVYKFEAEFVRADFLRFQRQSK